jgi:endonuclease/exonuclease/phosphatase family metal-dependent hydrolase
MLMSPTADHSQRAALVRLARTLTAIVLLLIAAVAPSVSVAAPLTGTFIDRRHPGDLRVVSYNVYVNSIFNQQTQGEKFARIVQALDPDVLNLQEVGSASGVVGRLNAILPLPGGATWYAHGSDDNVIASKYPLTLTALNTNPPKDGTAIALVDLPNDRFAADLYVMNNHLTCCNATDPPAPLDSHEVARQRQADALANWMRDARTPGGFIDLPSNTPMLVVGDLNTINPPNVLDPMGAILQGNIYYEALFGPDAPPDWDLTSLANALPLHNGRGPDAYTWRDDNQRFNPGVLDHIAYTDSVLAEANKFVLNTVAMTPAERLAAGLQEFDVTHDQVGRNYDHLPVVVDFRLVPEPSALVLMAIAGLGGVIRRRSSTAFSTSSSRAADT